MTFLNYQKLSLLSQDCSYKIYFDFDLRIFFNADIFIELVVL